ncbi:MAG: hypothetical protein Tsb0016_02030 [Sphingomonadales bacterium]
MPRLAGIADWRRWRHGVGQSGGWRGGKIQAWPIAAIFVSYLSFHPISGPYMKGPNMTVPAPGGKTGAADLRVHL